MNSRVPSLDIVVVNWNAGDYLRQCLESISLARTDEFEVKRVVVVDNASSDGSLNTVTALNLPLTLLRNMENRGFSAACNQGALGSTADYLLFLNPDTCLHTDSLRRPILFMESAAHARVGICGIRLVDAAGKMAAACARFPTLSIYVSQMFGLSAFFPRHAPRHFLSPEELLQNREVDQVIGAFFLVRRDLFNRLKGFDERFFVYFEEVDLSIRANREGYSSYYLSDVTALHVGRISSRQDSTMSLYHSLSSRLKYAAKHFKPWEKVGLIVLTFSVEFPARMVWAIVGSSVYSVRDILTAYKRLSSSLVYGGTSCR